MRRPHSFSSLVSRRPQCALTVWALLGGIGLGLLLPGAARAADYTVQVTVTDIDGHPLAGIQVDAGAIQTQPFSTTLQPEQSGTTDAAGQATLKLSTNSSPVGATVETDDPGQIHLPANPIVPLTKGANSLTFQLLPAPDGMRMAAGGTATTRGYFGDTGTSAYPALTTQSFTLDDSPLQFWRAYGGATGRPVLLVQGFFVTTDHPTPMQVFNQAFDLVQALRHAGRDVWVLGFSDPLAPFAAQALAVSDAVRAASQQANGAKVDVVGLSLGGLAARYALARDEATGGPSAGKVGVFATVDTPHQGANIQVAVQAALWVAGGDSDAPGGNLARRIVHSAAVQNLVDEWVGLNHYDEDTCGFPTNSSIKTTTAAHDAFFAELTALNGDGYPHQSRNVAVAASSPAPRPQQAGAVMYQLKASVDLLIGHATLCREDYPARAADVLPGSLFPGALLPDSAEVNAVTITLTRNFDPTFVPLASALDLHGATSPFAATFSAANGPLVHGAFPDGAVSFLMTQLAGG